MKAGSRHLIAKLALAAICAFYCFSQPQALAAGNETAATSEPAAGGDTWLTYNNTFNGQRFSPLKEIEPNNAANLKEVCRIKIAEGGSFQPGPVLVDGVMYVTTDTDTIALDPANCRMRWRSVYRPRQQEAWTVNRGVAFMDGRLYRGTGDGRLLALDAKTGKVLWEDVIGDPAKGEFFASAPIAWNGLVFIGTGGSDWGIRGRMMAFDGATGREAWRFYTIPMGKEVGADTWKTPQSARRGGGGMWTSYALDVSSAELFIPVGNPAPDFAPRYREGENLFTDAVVVLDARTGALKWWYQLTPHDAHDLDLAAPPMLYTNGKGREVVALAGKDGRVRAVDRETHKPVFSTLVTTAKNEDKVPTPEGVVVCPGALGGVEWNGPAFDPARKTIFVGSVDWCSLLTTETPEYVEGQFYFGGTWNQTGAATGWVTAIDSDSGKIRWRYHAGAPVVAGVTPTASGLVFTGDNAGNLLVFDSTSGKVLRKIDTGGAIAGGVITYKINGKQYVAATSGNISRSTFGAIGNPSIVILSLGREGATTNRIMAMKENPAKKPGTPDSAHGRNIYNLDCASCHGQNGQLVQGHNLKTLKARRNFDQMVAWLKNPEPPMPKLYPSVLSEHDLKDLAAFLQEF